MDCWHEDLREDWFVSVVIIWDFVNPISPLVLVNVIVVVIAQSTFWEFDFNNRSEHTIELIKDLVVILSTSDATTISPHGGKNEQSLIDNLLSFLHLFGPIKADNLLVIVEEDTVQNCADSLNEAHGRRRGQISDLCLVHHV